MSTCSVTSRATEFRIALLVFGLLAVLFIAFPQLDLAASGLFYRGDGQWTLNNESWWLKIPYRGLPRVGQGLLVGLLLLWLLSFRQRFPKLKARRAAIGFHASPAACSARSCWSTRR